MKVLFLDDDNLRHLHVSRECPGLDVMHVATAQGAIAALECHGPYDVVSLDHDLGQEGGVPVGWSGSSGPGCGLDVARWLAEHPDAACHVIVHSYNTPAADSMLAALADTAVPCERIPFGPGLVARLAALRGAA